MSDEQADLLLGIMNGVNVFGVDAFGNTQTTMLLDDTPLTVFQFANVHSLATSSSNNGQNSLSSSSASASSAASSSHGQSGEGSEEVEGFVQCGEWLFPLMPKRSPVLRAKRRFYVFPNPQRDATLPSYDQAISGTEAGAVQNKLHNEEFTGIIFTFAVPDEQVDAFEEILKHLADFRDIAEVEARQEAERANEKAQSDNRSWLNTGLSLGKTALGKAKEIGTTAVVTARQEYDKYQERKRVGTLANGGADADGLILSVKNVVCYIVNQQDESNLAAQGELKMIQAFNDCIVTIKDFSIPLSKIARSIRDRTTKGFKLIQRDGLQYLLLFDTRCPEDVFTKFEDIAREYVGEEAIVRERRMEERTWVDFLQQGLLKGSVWVAEAAVTGATVTGKAISYSGEKLKTVVPRKENHQVSPDAHRNAQALRKISGAAVIVSGVLVKSVTSMATHIAQQVSPIVSQAVHGPNGPQNPSKSSLSRIISTSALAANNVFDGMDRAAQIIFNDVKLATVNVVEHRYGEEAKTVATEALEGVGNFGKAAMDMRRVGVKAIAKAAATETTKQVFSDNATPNGRERQPAIQMSQQQQHQAIQSGSSSVSSSSPLNGSMQLPNANQLMAIAQGMSALSAVSNVLLADGGALNSVLGNNNGPMGSSYQLGNSSSSSSLERSNSGDSNRVRPPRPAPPRQLQ